MARKLKAAAKQVLQPGVYGKLNRLRLLLRARLAAEGLAWLLLALVAAVFLTLGLDYLLHLLRMDDQAQRAFVVALALAGVAYVAWRQLLGPLTVPMSPEALCLLVERRYSQLGDRLISAVQFALAETTEGMSAAMIARTAAEAQAAAEPLDFARVVERRRVWLSLALAAAAIVMLGGFSIWQYDLMGLWFQRNVLFAETPWPQQTYLEVLGGQDFAVLRGDDLPIEVAVREGSAAPAFITLHRLRHSLARPTEDRIEQATGNRGRYVRVIRAVNEPFEFYVTGGDDQTDKLAPHKVRVIDPPALREITFTVIYPEYTGLESRSFDGTREVLTVPFGGALEVDATASKPLSLAEVFVNGEKAFSVARGADTEAGSIRDHKLVGRFALPCENQLVSKTLRFVLTDTEGYDNRKGQVFTAQVLPDDPPDVELLKVGGLPAMRSATAAARIPLRVTVNDRYGIGLIELTDSHKPLLAEAAKKLALPAEEIVLRYRLPNVKVVLESKGSAVISEPATALVENAPVVRFEHLQTLDFNGRVEAGQAVRIFAVAEDGRPGELGGHGVGRSGVLDLEVVDAEVMQGKLLAAQKKAAEDFAAAIQLQSTAYAKTAAAAESEALGGQAVAALLGAGLGDSARAQSAVGDACDRAAKVFQGILEESQYNGIGEANEYAAMTQGIIVPLGGVVQRCAAAALELDGIVSTAGLGSPEERSRLPDRISAAAAEQQAILEEMKTIGRRMEKLRSLQAMADRVQRLIRWVEDLHREIQQQRDKKVEGIFEPRQGGEKP